MEFLILEKLYLEKLHLVNFRNHKNSQIEFGKNLNLIIGNNGQGKTNILEAISYLSITKSFLSASDVNVCNVNENFFEVKGNFFLQDESEYNVCVQYKKPSHEKIISLNKKKIETKKIIIGKFPIVVLSPYHYSLTFGVPSERRAFLDLVLSQTSKSYLDDIIAYKKILRQRNSLLYQFKERKFFDTELLLTWDEQIISVGSRIMKKRNDFLNVFQNFLYNAYLFITDENEFPSLNYKTQFHLNNNISLDEVQNLFSSEVGKNKEKEKILYSTLVGPHLDDIEFKINNFDVKKFASQGQHKTFLIAIKIAELNFLKNYLQKNPILLLDDVFSELDEYRTKKVFEMIHNSSQTFITSTSQNFVNFSFNEDAKIISVENGNIFEFETKTIF